MSFVILSTRSDVLMYRNFAMSMCNKGVSQCAIKV